MFRGRRVTTVPSNGGYEKKKFAEATPVVLTKYWCPETRTIDLEI